jgi:hypothetical protein
MKELLNQFFVSTILLGIVSLFCSGESLGAAADRTSRSIAENASEELKGPWVRIYRDYVQRVFVDGKNYQRGEPISPGSVFVALGHADNPKKSLEFRYRYIALPTRLINYGTNKYVTNTGCLLETPNSNDNFEHEQGRCEKLRQSTYETSGRDCARLAIEGEYVALFVSFNKKQIRCLISHHGQFKSQLPQNKSILWGLEIMSRVSAWRNYKDADVMGQSAFFESDNNQLFGCSEFGLPTTYREMKLIPGFDVAESIKTLTTLKPSWQNQYLIKTSGFTYYCHKAHRIIDEPVEPALALDDGTALLQGNVSVLRVRLQDGHTNAPKSLVRRMDATLFRERLYEGLSQPGECNPSIVFPCPILNSFGWQKNDTRNSDELFIRGVDQRIQGIFNKI